MAAARTAMDDRARAAWLEMAQNWLRFAEKAEAKGVTQQQQQQQQQPFPIVECPGCKRPMKPTVTEAGPGQQHTTTYRCEFCGADTKRTFTLDNDR